MRGIGNHTPPAVMQLMPPDNTSLYVWHQVAEWAATGIVVHSEIAREIAGGYATSAKGIGMAFTTFSTTGMIVEDFGAFIVQEFEHFRGAASIHDGSEEIGNVLWLKALHAYIVECEESPADDTDPREDGPSAEQEREWDRREDESRLSVAESERLAERASEDAAMRVLYGGHVD